MRNITEKSSKLLHSWGEIAPEMTFAGLTLEGFRAMVEPANEIRASIVEADQDRGALSSVQPEAVACYSMRPLHTFQASTLRGGQQANVLRLSGSSS